MPMKYNPDTGIPYYVPDLGEEIEEGVTPKPIVIDSKSDVFKGDKPLTQEQYNKLRDGGIPVSSDMGSDDADRLLAEAVEKAKPAKLDARMATDEEVAHLERLCNEHSVLHWPMLLRLINRLRKAEGK